MSINLNLEGYKKLPHLRLIVNPKIRKILNEHNFLNKLSISSNNKYRYINGIRSLPISYLYDYPSLFAKVIKSNPIFVTNGGVKVTLPNKINADIAYLTGLICGDGNLLLTKKRDYRITIHNKEKLLLKEALRIIEKNFSYRTKIRYGHKCWLVKVGSKVIYYFFNKILQIENGKKLNIVFPQKIKSNKELIRSFIAGFFDAEGSIGLKKNNITCQLMLYQKQREILEEIRKELYRDNIKTNLYKTKANCWVLYGNKDSLKPFHEKIKFLHPKKRNKLETALRNAKSIY